MKHTLFALALLTTPAMAADISQGPIEVQAYEEEANWSGITLGIGLGAGAVVNDTSVDIGHFGASIDGIGGEGLLGEVMFGLQHQFQNNVVLGAEAAVGYKDFQTEINIGPVNVDASPEWTGRVSGILGYAFDDTMPFLFGGYSIIDAYDVEISGPGGSASFSEQYHGWHAGAGINHMLTPDWAIGLRYQYTQYQGENWTVPGLDVEPSTHQGMLTLTYLANFWQ